MKLEASWVEPLLEKFLKCRILVIGDLILDRFVWGRVERISPEAPVPVVLVERESSHLGGAANVALNLIHLGGQVSLLGALGEDRAARELSASLEDAGIAAQDLVMISGRTTSVKTRIVAHNQQICRTDRECRDPLGSQAEEELFERFQRSLEGCDAVILSDYGKGVLAGSTALHLIQKAREAAVPVAVDPKFTDFSLYRQASVITPNSTEAVSAAGPIDGTDIEQVAESLLRRSESDYILITRGEEGMLLAGRGGERHQIPASAREVYDVTGAGDTVVSVLALGLAGGASMLEAALLANCAAGLVVEKLGTASLGPDEIRNRLADS